MERGREDENTKKSTTDGTMQIRGSTQEELGSKKKTRHCTSEVAVLTYVHLAHVFVLNARALASELLHVCMIARVFVFRTECAMLLS